MSFLRTKIILETKRNLLIVRPYFFRGQGTLNKTTVNKYKKMCWLKEWPFWRKFARVQNPNEDYCKWQIWPYLGRPWRTLPLKNENNINFGNLMPAIKQKWFSLKLKWLGKNTRKHVRQCSAQNSIFINNF